MKDFHGTDKKQEDTMRKFCREVFGTDHPEDLKIIAEKARKYDLLFDKDYPVNQRNAGRKARFSEEDRKLMVKLYQEGVSVQDIAYRFQTSRQTIYKYIQLAKQVRENSYITMRMNYMYKEELCTTIDVDFMHKKVYVENQTDNILHRAFGVVQDPDWERFEEFLESRCFPRSRANLKEILRDIGVDSYDPLQIIEKTGGRMAEDKQWIEIIYYDRRGSGEEWKK